MYFRAYNRCCCAQAAAWDANEEEKKIHAGVMGYLMLYTLIQLSGSSHIVHDIDCCTNSHQKLYELGQFYCHKLLHICE